VEGEVALFKWLDRSAAGDGRISVSVEWRVPFFKRRKTSERRIVYFSKRVEGPDTQKDLIELARITYRHCDAIWREILDKNL
jgi:hypothetical protein